MEHGINQAIDELEKQLLLEPNSPSLYDRLLWMYFDQESLYGHPRRINHIIACIRRFPRNTMCQTPFVQVDPKVSHDGFQRIEREWIRLLNENPEDAKIAIGAANFYCMKDLKQAIEILKSFIEKDPSQANVWLNLGRYITDPKESLYYLKEAQRRGAIQPNLLVWLARSAADACEFSTAESYGKELLGLVADARAKYGNKLDWKEKGKSLFSKALDATGICSGSTAHTRFQQWERDGVFLEFWRQGLLEYDGLRKLDWK